VHRGINYRTFLPTDRAFGEWSHFGFPSDGSAPYNFRTGLFSEKSTTTTGYRCVKLRHIETGRQFKNHIGVAYLFGARKNTDYPMSLLLVVDHIVEGDKTDFRLDNLQIATQMQNAQKSYGVAEAAGAGAGAGAGTTFGAGNFP
jgi:hypothetical protein